MNEFNDNVISDIWVSYNEKVGTLHALLCVYYNFTYIVYKVCMYRVWPGDKTCQGGIAVHLLFHAPVIFPWRFIKSKVDAAQHAM